MSLEGDDDDAASEHHSSIAKSSPALAGSSPGSLFARSSVPIMDNRTPSPHHQSKYDKSGTVSDASLASAMQNQLSF